MNPLFDAALEVQRFMDERQWSFCIIGGLAVARWGQPRATAGVDFSLLTGLGGEGKFIDALLGGFRARLADARQFALQARVLLLKATNDVPLDIALAAFPYEKSVIDRATVFSFSSMVHLRIASAEDMVVLKAFAGREQDWADVQGIVERQAKTLDWSYIEAELKPLSALKQDPTLVERLLRIRTG